MAFININDAFQMTLLETQQPTRLNFKNLLAEARGQTAVVPVKHIAVVKPKPPLRKITAEYLAQVKIDFVARSIRPWALKYLKAQHDVASREFLEEMIYNREMDAETTKNLIIDLGAISADPRIDTPIQAADALIERENIDVPPGSNERAAIIIELRRAQIQAEQEIDRLLRGEEPAIVPVSQAIPKPQVLSFRDAVEQYTAAKTMRPKTANDVRASLKLFEAEFGNLSLAELKLAHFRDFMKALASKTVGGRSSGSLVRSMSVSSVKRRIGLLRAAINFTIQQGLFEGLNPAAGLDPKNFVAPQDKSVVPTKRRFKVDELNAVFKHPWFAGCASASQPHLPGTHRLLGVEYWGPIVALHTGCRAAELGGLKLTEIDTDGAFPCIHIQDNEFRLTKGGYDRFVPIIDQLFELGFAEYVNSVRRAGAIRLFPDWLSPKSKNGFDRTDAAWSNASWVRKFNRNVVPFALGDRLAENTRSPVTFHSFRGAFKAMLGLHQPHVAPNIINEVIGHSKGEMDSRYVGVVALEETYPAIRACRWNGLILPSSPS